MKEIKINHFSTRGEGRRKQSVERIFFSDIYD